MPENNVANETGKGELKDIPVPGKSAASPPQLVIKPPVRAPLKKLVLGKPPPPPTPEPERNDKPLKFRPPEAVRSLIEKDPVTDEEKERLRKALEQMKTDQDVKGVSRIDISFRYMPLLLSALAVLIMIIVASLMFLSRAPKQPDASPFTDTKKDEQPVKKKAKPAAPDNSIYYSGPTATPAIIESNVKTASEVVEKKTVEIKDTKAADEAMEKVLAGIKAGNGEDAIIEYKEFLKQNGVAGPALAAKIAPLAMLLPDPSFAHDCLEAMSQDSALAYDWRILSIRFKLLYTDAIPEEAAFDGLDTPEGIRLHALCLLSKGLLEDALNLAKTSSDSPTFLEVFLLWRLNSSDWTAKADTLLKRGTCTTPETLALRVMTGVTKTDEARSQIDAMSKDDAALLSLMLAETCKRNGSGIASKVLYSKASRISPNSYKKIIECLRDK